MKTKCIALVVCLLATINIYSQETNKANTNIQICNSDKPEFSKTELLKCHQINVKDQELEVVSMLVSLSLENGLVEFNVQGNSFNRAVLFQLEKDIEYKYLYLEKVTLADGSEVGFNRFKISNE